MPRIEIGYEPHEAQIVELVEPDMQSIFPFGKKAEEKRSQLIKKVVEVIEKIIEAWNKDSEPKMLSYTVDNYPYEGGLLVASSVAKLVEKVLVNAVKGTPIKVGRRESVDRSNATQTDSTFINSSLITLEQQDTPMERKEEDKQDR